jgi:hypothetical protein
MAALNEFLSALVGATQDPIRLTYGDVVADVESDLDAAVADAGDEPIYLAPVTCNGEVPFLYTFTENAVEDEWQDLNLKPTAVLFKDGLLICAYALEAVVYEGDEVNAVAEAMGGFLTDPIPTPGANGWTLLHVDPDTFYPFQTLADLYQDEAVPEIVAEIEARVGTLEAAVDAASPPWESEDHGALNDATLLTPFALDDPRYAQEMTISIGANRESTKWNPKAMPIWQFVDMLSRHREDKNKDGLAFVLAEIVGAQRKKVAVSNCYGVGLDIDVGVPGRVIDEALVKLGCLAVRYTTHSHGKASTKLLKDRVAKWLVKNGEDEVTEEGIIRFLREESRWDESIISTVEYVGDVQEPEGFMIDLHHIPMPKHRVVLPLAAPFVPTQVAKTHNDGMNLWGDVCRSLARALGDLPMDRSAVDPSRLFYFPRHAKGRPHETTIIGGDLLDWKSLDLSEPDKHADAGEYAALLNEIDREDKGKSKGKSTTDEGKKLGRWSIKRAGGFQVVDLIRDYADERIRTNGSNKIDIECPFDEEHSNPGDPEDKGCFAVNAGDGPSEIFTIKCQHDSCSQRTNLDFLGKMLKDQWFGEDLLDDPNYNATLDEDAPEPTPEAAKIEKEDQARDSLDDMIANVSALSSDEEVDAVITALLEANLNSRARMVKEAALKKALAMPKAHFDKMIKMAQKAMSKKSNARDDVKDPKGRYVFSYENDFNFDEAFDACFKTMRLTNEKAKEPVFSCVNDQVVRLTRDKNGRITFDNLDKDGLWAELNRRMTFMRRSDTGDGTRDPVPEAVSKYVLEQAYTELPQSPEIIYTPLFTGAGDLVMTPGYKPSLNMIMASQDMIVDVPENPTADDVAEAVAFLRDEVLSDFPFLDHDLKGEERRAPSEANCLAMLITPFMRRMINGCTPVFFVAKPTPGTGGTLLGKLPMLIFDGNESAPMRYTQNEEEMQKALLSAILETRSHLFFDDVLDFNNRSLLQSITAQEIGGRLLGSTRNVSRPNTFNWIGTGNNPNVGSEMERRICWIRLNAKTPDIQNRIYKHDDFPGFIRENRAKIIGYILTMIQYWIDVEMPTFEDRRRASFEDWSRKVGGVLMCAGIEGFLDNRKAVSADIGDIAIRAFVKEWLKKFGFDKVTNAKLFEHAMAMELDIIEGNNDDQKKQRFPKKLYTMDGRVFRIDDQEYIVNSGVNEEGDPIFYLAVNLKDENSVETDSPTPEGEPIAA